MPIRIEDEITGGQRLHMDGRPMATGTSQLKHLEYGFPLVPQLGAAAMPLNPHGYSEEKSATSPIQNGSSSSKGSWTSNSIKECGSSGASHTCCPLLSVNRLETEAPSKNVPVTGGSL